MVGSNGVVSTLFRDTESLGVQATSGKLVTMVGGRTAVSPAFTMIATFPSWFGRASAARSKTQQANILFDPRQTLSLFIVLLFPSASAGANSQDGSLRLPAVSAQFIGPN